MEIGILLFLKTFGQRISGRRLLVVGLKVGGSQFSRTETMGKQKCIFVNARTANAT